MEILMDEVNGTFEIDATEMIVINHKGYEYQAEVQWLGGYGTPNPEVEIQILERGLSTELEEELIQGVREYFEKYYNLKRDL